MKRKKVISLGYNEVDTAGNRQSDFQGPNRPWRPPYVTEIVLTSQRVNDKVGVGFL